METINISFARSLLFVGITTLSLLIFFPISAFAQSNMSNNSALKASSNAELPLKGVYQLLYAEAGGLKPVHEFYVYNILDNHLTFVDLDNKTIRTKVLNASAVD